MNLDLDPVMPPSVLYHETSEHNLPKILRGGLEKMRRHHVHLSPDEATAVKVAARHRRPAVLRVDAAAMRRDGWTFYRSGNGVWLVERIPPRYLARIPPPP